MQQYECAKFSIDQVVFTLEKVHIIWERLLLAQTYKRSMCIVLDSVFSRITEDILLLDDLPAEETLQRLLHLTLESLSSLFESLLSIKGKGKLLEGIRDIQLDELIPSLCKLRKLAGLLDIPLKSITTTWETGELANCCFTASEDSISALYISRLPRPGELHGTVFDRFPQNFEDVTLEDFMHAYALAGSRAWGSSRGLSLIPLANFLNHDGLSKAVLLSDEHKEISAVIFRIQVCTCWRLHTEGSFQCDNTRQSPSGN